MKSAEEIMEILEAFDLTGSCRDAAVLAGCSHHTVAQLCGLVRRAGVDAGSGRAAADADRCVPGRSWRSGSSVRAARIRADVAHDKLAAMGFVGSERTTRRAVAEVKSAWRSGRGRVHRPWIPGAGMWFAVRLR